MAHGENQRRVNRRNEKVWFGKRPLSFLAVVSGHMRLWKRLLHKIERRQSKNIIDDEILEI